MVGVVFYLVLRNLFAVVPRVSALAGCDRNGIRAEGYREYWFSFGEPKL